MPACHSPFPLKAVGYALLGQAIWLPLVAIALHDRWFNTAAAPTRAPAASSGPAAAAAAAAASGPAAAAGAAAGSPAAGMPRPTTTGLLLGSAGRGAADPLTGRLAQARDRSGRGAAAAPLQHRSGPLPAGVINTALLPTRPVTANQLLLQEFRPSELLGGPIGLHEAQAPVAMPALALAERARWAGSPDPLAPLPSDWREPMRRALGSLPAQPRAASRLEPARVVHVPSSRIRTGADVPLALQSDGSVDILSSPDDPAVVEEIRSWSRRQQAPAAGSVVPAVVRLHPMPQARPASRLSAVAPPAASPGGPPPVAASPAPLSAPAAAIAPAPAAAPEPAAAAPAP